MKWPEIRLGHIADIQGGGTPRRNNTDFWNGKIPWLTPTDLPKPGDGIKFVNDTLNKISEKGLNNSSAKLLPIGTVLFSSRATIGKIGISNVPMTTNQGFINFIPNETIESKYLAYALMFYHNKISLLAGSTTFKEVSKSSIKGFKIPVPPLSEQRKIVEILDQADALRKLRAEADAKAERILPALFYKMFGDPVTNPMGWPTFKISELTVKIEKRNPKDKPDEHFKYVDIAGIDGVKGKITKYKQLIGSEAPSRARQIIKNNDVIISTVRPYLRATALVPEQLSEEICSTGFCVLRTKEDYGFGYLYALTRLQWFTDTLNSMARGASYPAVTDRDILNLKIPIPSDDARLAKFDDAVLQLQTAINDRVESKNRIETLFGSILHRAFSGDLTAKWREAHMKELLKEMEEQAKALKKTAEKKK